MNPFVLSTYEKQRELAFQLVDIGLKALTTKLHPDKRGSHDGIGRLNHVRDRLRQVAEYREFQVKQKARKRTRVST
jgi:hypothetical protein